MQQWLAILKPWFRALRECSAGNADDIDDDGTLTHIVYLTIHSPRKSWKVNVVEQREALELLVTVAAAARVSWFTLLQHVRKALREQYLLVASTIDTIEDASPQTYNVVLQIKGKTLADRSAEAIATFLLAFDASAATPPSEAFCNAMQAIHAQLSPTESTRVVALCSSIAIDIGVNVTQNSKCSLAGLALCKQLAGLALCKQLVHGVAERFSATLVATAGASNNSDGATWQYRYPYNVTLRLFGIGHRVTIEAGGAALLAELVALGAVYSDDLSLRVDGAWCRLPVSEFGLLLSALTDTAAFRAANGIPQLLSSHSAPPLTLRKWGSEATATSHANDPRKLQHVVAALSALATSHDVSSVRFDTFCHSGSCLCAGRILRWLGYALLSKHASSTISKLMIQDTSLLIPTAQCHVRDVRSNDVRECMRVLAAANPARALLAGDDDNVADDGTPDLGTVFLRAGTVVNVEPVRGCVAGANSVVDSVTLKHDGSFHVMRDDAHRERIDIVVPCFGHCSVARAAVDHAVPAPSATAATSSLAAGYNGAIRELTLRDTNHVALLPLICFLGRKLQSLTIIAELETVSSAFVERVIAQCPGLKHLGICNPEPRVVDVLMDAFARGKCSIESLDLGRVLSSEPWPSLTPLWDALEDTTSHTAKTLRRLTLRPPRSYDYEETTLDDIATMLDANHTLTYFEYEVDGEEFDDVPAALRRTAGRWVVCSPLSTECRIAFLSVVQQLSSSTRERRPDQSSKRARTTRAASSDVNLVQLDRIVIERIFAFAATGVGRKLQIYPSCGD